MPGELSLKYCTEEDIYDFMSIEGVDLRSDHTFRPRLLSKAINYATAFINRYCLGRYPANQLTESWEVNVWATVVACRWLCMVRMNPVPVSLAQLYAEVLDVLSDIKKGVYYLEDVSHRVVEWPAWSNAHVDHRFILRKIRVQRPISERTPTTYRQNVDWLNEWTVEP